MKCLDCNDEIEVFGSKSKQICKSCYRRYINCKSKGIEYIKLIDLTDEERQKIENRKNSAKRASITRQNTISKMINKEFKRVSNNKIQKEKEIVLKDIEKVFITRGIKYPLEINSIKPVFIQIKILLDSYSDYIKNFISAEDILNRMELDYKHAKEHYSTCYQNLLENQCSTDELLEIENKKKLWEERHNILMNYRRDIKNVLLEYKNGGTIFIDLAKDKEFMIKFNNYYNNLVKVTDIIEEGAYKAEVSSLVESEDFCLGFKNNPLNKRKFLVTIKTQYKGSSSIFTRSTFAVNENEAKKNIVDFINSRPEQFKFSWKDKDITVTILNPKGRS